MVQLLATCPVHGPFPSGFELGEGSHNNTFAGNFSGCPVCGALSPVQSGTFSVINGLLRLTGQLTPEEMRQLHRTALRAASGETAYEEAQAEATAISPRFQLQFGNLSAEQWTLLVAVLSLLLTAYGILAHDPQLEDISAKLSQHDVTAERIAELLEEQHQTDEEILEVARRVAEAAEAMQEQHSEQEAQPPEPLQEKDR